MHMGAAPSKAASQVDLVHRAAAELLLPVAWLDQGPAGRQSELWVEGPAGRHKVLGRPIESTHDSLVIADNRWHDRATGIYWGM